jgi:predicted ribosome quality control (RQC) complex YloA/Tae2 family protein
MENFAVIALAETLKPATSELVIRRVVQHQTNGFILHTRSPKLSALKVIVEAQNPAFYESEAKPPVDSPPSDFLMVLRKHLTSAELIEFQKPLSERIVEMTFKTVVPSKELETITLVIELIPNAPNIILLDAERRVLTSFLPLTQQHEGGEFDVYAFPVSRGKIPLETVLADESALVEYDNQPDPQQWLIKTVAGIVPMLAGEIVFRQKRSNKPVTEEIRTLLRLIKEPSHAAWIYTDLPLGHILEQNDLRRLQKAIISPIELHSLERSHSSRLFANIIDATRFYFDELESRTALEQAKLPIVREMRLASKKMADREKRLLREEQSYRDAEILRKNGQMLVSSGLKPDQRYESVTVTDYFGDEPRPVQIALNPTLTLRENIDKMFKRHAKADRGKGIVAQQLAQIRKRQAAVVEQVRRLQAIKDWDTWLAISSRIEKEQGSRLSNSDRTLDGDPTEKPAKRFRRVVIEGYEILVGRSSRENDELTFNVAAPDDFWFHVSEYSGSHVVVRNPERKRELEDEILTKAAQMAAFFSQARNSKKVEVHYTRKKHVAKPRRAKPGLARLIEFKSITVEPKNWLEG